MQDHSRYSVSDPANPKFQAFATLDYSTLTSLKQDELTLTIRTKLDNGQRSTVLRGRIRGSWSYDDNLEAFNRAVAAGAQPEEAAVKTWTGQQAAAAGYTRVVIRSLEGQAGGYKKVVACFFRP